MCMNEFLTMLPMHLPSFDMTNGESADHFGNPDSKSLSSCNCRWLRGGVLHVSGQSSFPHSCSDVNLPLLYMTLVSSVVPSTLTSAPHGLLWLAMEKSIAVAGKPQLLQTST